MDTFTVDECILLAVCRAAICLEQKSWVWLIISLQFCFAYKACLVRFWGKTMASFDSLCLLNLASWIAGWLLTPSETQWPSWWELWHGTICTTCGKLLRTSSLMHTPSPSMHWGSRCITHPDTAAGHKSRWVFLCFLPPSSSSPFLLSLNWHIFPCSLFFSLTSWVICVCFLLVLWTWQVQQL